MSVSGQATYYGTIFDGVTGVGAPQSAVLHTKNRQMISFSNRKVNGKYRSGQTWFQFESRTDKHPSGSFTLKDNQGKYPAYTGKAVIEQHWAIKSPPSGWNSNNPNSADRLALFNRGAEAYAKLRPAKPDFGAALALAELKDLPNSLRMATKAILRRIAEARLRRKGRGRFLLSQTGEWYLAIQFGWLPLLNDIRSFMDTFRKGAGNVDSLVKFNKKLKRYSTTLSDPRDGENYQQYGNQRAGANIFPLLVSKYYYHPTNGGPQNRRTQSVWTVQSKTWAVGYFAYFLPEFPNGKLDKEKIIRRKLYGRFATPSMVYNLIPWSWLADYFTSLGSALDAVSNGVEDSLYSQSCYIMRKSTWTMVTNVTEVYANISISGKTSPVTVTSGMTTKSTQQGRCVASPFGFGITGNSLSSRQGAILAALGLSRL